MNDRIDCLENQGNQATRIPGEGEIMETIQRGQEAARRRIIELIGKAQKKAAEGDIETAYHVLATADIIAVNTGDTEARTMIAAALDIPLRTSI